MWYTFLKSGGKVNEKYKDKVNCVYVDCRGGIFSKWSKKSVKTKK